MASIVNIVEEQDIRFGPAEWTAFESMTENPRDSVPEILREWLRDHGWARARRPRPGGITWQEAVLLRYLATSSLRIRAGIMADTPLRNYTDIVARLERKGLVQTVRAGRAAMEYTVNGYILTDAGNVVAADLVSERSGGRIPRKIRDDLAATWDDVGHVLVPRWLQFTIDDWRAAEAAAESAYASGGLLVRVIIRAWITKRGWNESAAAPDTDAVLCMLRSREGRPGRVLKELGRTPRARRAGMELATALDITKDLIYPTLYALERCGWVSKKEKPSGYIITPEGIQAAILAGLVKVGEGEAPHSRPAPVYTAFGEEKTLPQWAADPRCEVGAGTLRNRIAAGESIEAAIGRGPDPVGRHRGQASTAYNALYTAFGEEKTLPQWAADPRCKVIESTLRQRVARGESFEVAMSRPSRAGRGRPRKVQRTSAPDDFGESMDAIKALLEQRASAPDDFAESMDAIKALLDKQTEI